MNFEDFSRLVKSRRSNLLIDPERQVEPEVVNNLCDLAVWAPNHKLTLPWCFANITRSARSRLGEVIAEAMILNGDIPEKVAKARTKYLRSPVVIVAGSKIVGSEIRIGEDRDAVAAGIQNILLGATVIGLASYWSSCPRGAAAKVAEFCGFEQGTQIVGIIYLGWPNNNINKPERGPAEIFTIEN